ncbi:MAG: MFS transporter [Pseudomonadales bacterium]
MKQRSEGLAGFINRRLFYVTLIATLLASVLSALYTLAQFNQSLKPQLLQKIEVAVDSVRLDVDLAVDVGIPLSSIRGLDDYLAQTLTKYPELEYLAVSDESGLALYQHRRDAAPIAPLNQAQSLQQGRTQERSLRLELAASAAQLIELIAPSSEGLSTAEHYFLPLANGGAVQVGLDSTYIRSQLSDVFFDIAIVLIAVLLVSFEVVMVLVMFYVTAPLRRSEKLLQRQAEGDFSVNEQRAGQGAIEHYNRQLNSDCASLQQTYRSALAQQGNTLSEQLTRLAEKFNLVKVLREKRSNVLDARIPLFVFAFAEELQKSFMPLFVAQYYEPNPWISEDIVLALPISIFMLVIALATPFAGGWVDRFGNKKLFMLGLIPALLGYLGCALAESSTHIIFARAVTAFGYAIITISCQGYIAAAVPPENRAKGMAIFVGVLMTATMSGTALGGIIADRIGYHNVFFISAILTLAAGALAWAMLSADKPEPKGSNAVRGSSALKALASNREFVSIILFCAIPAKIILTGFLYYLVPLYLLSLEASQSEIGRIMMVYALVIIPLSPVASQFADRCGKMMQLVILGTVLSGLILISLYQSDSVVSVLVAIAMMGAAHSILKAPLIAAALTSAESSAGVGRTTVLGILRTSERIGSVLGPLLVGALLLYFDFTETLAIIGVGIVCSGAVMAYFSLRSKPMEVQP